ncbi:uncharacterized protein LOC108207805 [Daucus carota subsp. sativus]|uniref:Transmembrane protein n=1 Tax=Daucus carota subsp. sativus TaxID=79200 RepID=A0A166F2M9_DAUCS|nr:PREDICTED: uncharacterized protein LOC108207805 [Daucus carota subsp. sativus]
MASFHSHLLTVLLVSSFYFCTLGSLDSLLEIYGLPRGLFPQNVKSYSLDQDNILKIELEAPCLVMFETYVFYEKVVRANLTERKLLGVKGLSNKELFIWLPVNAVVVNYPTAGVVMFDITVANKTIPLSHFEKPPSCRSEGQMPLKPREGGSGVWI